MIRIEYERSKCIGCHACAELFNSRWRVSRKDGKCSLIGAKQMKKRFIGYVHNDEESLLIKVVENCPEKLITINRVN